MKKKPSFKKFLQFFLIFCAVLMISIPASAATQKNAWSVKNGKYYYYDKDGNLTKGSKKINKKYYYFASDGKQRIGWVTYGGNYYYYRIARGANAYRVSGKSVDGIKIGTDGKAIVTSSNKSKLNMLVAANKIVHEKTSWNMNKAQRLRAVFDYMVNGIRYRNIGSFRRSTGWPEYYADYMFSKGYGDCYAAGCAFAYLATAVGYKKVYAVSSGGHGWCKIDDAVYDPNWAKMTGKTNRYYGFTRSIRRTSQDPAYFKNEYYKVRIDN